MRISKRQGTMAAATVITMLTLGTGTAAANHSHFIYQPAHGNHPATCRYIAAGQTSKLDTDPGGHAFHRNVHAGQPGTDDRGTDFDKETNADKYDCVWVNQP